MVVGTFVNDLVRRSRDVSTETSTIVSVFHYRSVGVRRAYLKFPDAYIVPFIHVCIFKTEGLDGA